jgi:hypothetical protein
MSIGQRAPPQDGGGSPRLDIHEFQRRSPSHMARTTAMATPLALPHLPEA